MGEKSREVEERENESEGKALLSPVLCACCVSSFFFFFLLLAAFQSSEGRPCWVEHSASLSFKSHSLSRFPLRISQRDQQRRESDGKSAERRREKRQAADVWKERKKRKKGGRYRDVRPRRQELKTWKSELRHGPDSRGGHESAKNGKTA